VFEAVVLEILVEMALVAVNAILGFGVLYQLKLGTNYFWILLQYSLMILRSIKRHLEFIQTHYKSLSPVLAYWLTATHTL
jgi:hypothetical protein